MRLLLAVLLCAVAFGATQFSPADVTILGDIDYGQTSPTLDCPGEPKYCALVFNANGGDKVQVTVSAGKAVVALADGTLTELARGSGTLVFSLPASQEPVTYYIVMRDEGGKPGKFTVELKKLGGA